MLLSVTEGSESLLHDLFIGVVVIDGWFGDDRAAVFSFTDEPRDGPEFGSIQSSRVSVAADRERTGSVAEEVAVVSVTTNFPESDFKSVLSLVVICLVQAGRDGGEYLAETGKRERDDARNEKSDVVEPDGCRREEEPDYEDINPV